MCHDNFASNQFIDLLLYTLINLFIYILDTSPLNNTHIYT